jgi:hypothetical protein
MCGWRSAKVVTVIWDKERPEEVEHLSNDCNRTLLDFFQVATYGDWIVGAESESGKIVVRELTNLSNVVHTISQPYKKTFMNDCTVSFTSLQLQQGFHHHGELFDVYFHRRQPADR